MIVETLGENVHIVFKKDSGVTGNLNVSISKKGQKSVLIHSKKSGDGLVNDTNRDAFIMKVKNAVK